MILVSYISFLHSPLKFVGGDCWPRGPMLTGSPSLQPMEVSTVEQMDTNSSGNSEASAPLPIRHPSGINAGPYKKQAYPMNSKRPEHLRMNLWRPARTRTLGISLPLFPVYCFLSERLVGLFFKIELTPSMSITSSFSSAFPFLGLPNPPDSAWLPQPDADNQRFKYSKYVVWRERGAFQWKQTCLSAL